MNKICVSHVMTQRFEKKIQQLKYLNSYVFAFLEEISPKRESKYAKKNFAEFLKSKAKIYLNAKCFIFLLY